VKNRAQLRRPTPEELGGVWDRLIDEQRMAVRATIEAQVIEGVKDHERWRATRSMTPPSASQNPSIDPAHVDDLIEEEDDIIYDDESVEPLYEETPAPVPAWFRRERYPNALHTNHLKIRVLFTVLLQGGGGSA